MANMTTDKMQPGFTTIGEYVIFFENNRIKNLTKDGYELVINVTGPEGTATKKYYYDDAVFDGWYIEATEDELLVYASVYDHAKAVYEKDGKQVDEKDVDCISNSFTYRVPTRGIEEKVYGTNGVLVWPEGFVQDPINGLTLIAGAYRVPDATGIGAFRGRGNVHSMSPGALEHGNFVDSFGSLTEDYVYVDATPSTPIDEEFIDTWLNGDRKLVSDMPAIPIEEVLVGRFKLKKENALSDEEPEIPEDLEKEWGDPEYPIYPDETWDDLIQDVEDEASDDSVYPYSDSDSDSEHDITDDNGKPIYKPDKDDPSSPAKPTNPDYPLKNWPPDEEPVNYGDSRYPSNMTPIKPGEYGYPSSSDPRYPGDKDGDGEEDPYYPPVYPIYDPEVEETGEDARKRILKIKVAAALSGRHNDPIVGNWSGSHPLARDAATSPGSGGDGGNGGGGGAGASTLIMYKFSTTRADSHEITATTCRHGYGSGGGMGGKGGDGAILIYY